MSYFVDRVFVPAKLGEFLKSVKRQGLVIAAIVGNNNPQLPANSIIPVSSDFQILTFQDKAIFLNRETGISFSVRTSADVQDYSSHNFRSMCSLPLHPHTHQPDFNIDIQGHLHINNNILMDIWIKL